MVLLSLPICPSLFICLNLLEYPKHAWSKYMQDPKDLSPRFTDKMRGQLATVFILMFVCFAYLGFGFNYICIPAVDISGYGTKEN